MMTTPTQTFRKKFANKSRFTVYMNDKSVTFLEDQSLYMAALNNFRLYGKSDFVDTFYFNNYCHVQGLDFISLIIVAIGASVLKMPRTDIIHHTGGSRGLFSSKINCHSNNTALK